MIRPSGFRGAAFGTAAEGDPRLDEEIRRRLSADLGIPEHWATVTQVHGSDVVEAARPGPLGEADAIVTRRPGLPACVATADCVPVILESPDAVGVVHAGWRGVASGVVEAAIAHLRAMGAPPVRAAIGPAIGPCCYEVGPEVARHFPDHVRATSWGTLSVDLKGYIADVLGDIEVWQSELCTFSDADLHSHRRDGTRERQVAVGWLPTG